MKLSFPLLVWSVAATSTILTNNTSAFVPHSKVAYKTSVASSSTLKQPTVEKNPQTTDGSAPDVAAVMPSSQAPGSTENNKFQCDESVRMWRDFQASGFSSTEENLDQMRQVAARFASMGPESRQFFAKHLGRSSYFIFNAILGSTAYQLHERLVRRDQVLDDMVDGILPMNINTQMASRLILEALHSYEQDYQWIQRGIYREPWDMALTNRQANPVNLVTASSRFVREAVGTLGRRATGRQEDKKVKYFGKSAASSSNFYPEYYQNAFHFQTDGWMSSDSAAVYETSTETLFVGRQDAMQRTSLPPLMEAAATYDKSKHDGRPMRVLEVACGTGRFMTFVRDNLPLDAEYTAVDLSPFYLEKARDNDSYWRTTRANEEQSKSGAKPDILPANLVQAKAEELPFEDGSFDAVVCVYLFHELPREIRKQAAAEMARVVAPGGTVVFTDSIQQGDRPILDGAIGNFERMNEPYYGDFLVDDLAGHFENAGLKPLTKIVRSTSKSLSFKKPADSK